jgi:hypothetical protein
VVLYLLASFLYLRITFSAADSDVPLKHESFQHPYLRSSIIRGLSHKVATLGFESIP